MHTLVPSTPLAARTPKSLVSSVGDAIWPPRKHNTSVSRQLFVPVIRAYMDPWGGYCGSALESSARATHSRHFCNRLTLSQIRTGTGSGIWTGAGLTAAAASVDEAKTRPDTGATSRPTGADPPHRTASCVMQSTMLRMNLVDPGRAVSSRSAHLQNYHKNSTNSRCLSNYDIYSPIQYSLRIVLNIANSCLRTVRIIATAAHVYPQPQSTGPGWERSACSSLELFRAATGYTSTNMPAFRFEVFLAFARSRCAFLTVSRRRACPNELRVMPRRALSTSGTNSAKDGTESRHTEQLRVNTAESK